KAYYVGKTSQRYAQAVSAVVMSRLTGFSGMLLISLPALWLWHRLFSRTIITVYLLSCLAMVGAITSVLLAVTLLPGLLKWKWAQNRIVTSLNTFGTTMRKSIQQPRTLLVACLFGMIFHLNASLNYYVYASMFHLHVPLAFYLVAIPLVSLIAF